MRGHIKEINDGDAVCFVSHGYMAVRKTGMCMIPDVLEVGV